MLVFIQHVLSFWCSVSLWYSIFEVCNGGLEVQGKAGWAEDPGVNPKLSFWFAVWPQGKLWLSSYACSLFFFDEDKFLWFFRRVLYGQMNLGRTIPMKHILRDEISREAPNPRGFGGWSLVPFPPYKYSQAFKHTGAGGLCQLISREKEQFENLRTF